MNDGHTQTDALDDLLDQERNALLAGDLEQIAHLLPKKEKLVTELLEDASEERPSLNVLQNKLTHNQLLLDGAMQGIRIVASRLAALRQVREALDTYDAHGRKQRAAAIKPAKVERRA